MLKLIIFFLHIPDIIFITKTMFNTNSVANNDYKTRHLKNHNLDPDPELKKITIGIHNNPFTAKSFKPNIVVNSLIQCNPESSERKNIREIYIYMLNIWWL